MSGEYVLVFDYLDMPLDPAPWQSGLRFIIIGFVIGCVGAVLKRKTYMAFGGFIVVFATFWSVAVFANTHSAFADLEAAREAGRYEVVEGTVEDYSLTPPNAPRLERFRVGDRTFEYRGYHWTPGFNLMASQGGPIRPDLPVRIGSIDGTIVRLEVGQTAPALPASD